MQESLENLDWNLRKINSRLYVIRGNPKETFPRLFKEWNCSILTFESDIEPYSVERDSIVIKLARQYKVEVIQECSHTIFDPELVLKINGGSPPLTYQKFLSVVNSMPKPTTPVDSPNEIPSSCVPDKDKLEISNNKCYDVPSIEELGIEKNKLGSLTFPGGETEALKRMEMNLKRTKWICEFEKPNTSPNSLEPSTTVLSPYLKFGCLSSRLFYQEIKKVYAGQKHSKPPVSLEGQLLWREFYYSVATATPNFDKMVGNRICAQIPWENKKHYIEAWTNGKTGQFILYRV